MEFKMIYGTFAISGGIFIACLFGLNIISVAIVVAFLMLQVFLYKKFKNRIYIIITVLFLFGSISYTFVLNKESKLKCLEGKTIDINAIILEEGNPDRSHSTYIAQIRVVTEENNNYAEKEKIILKDYSKNKYKPGDIVKTRGNLEGIIGKRNFGDNDFRLYYKGKGIYNQFKTTSAKKVGISKSFKILLLYNMRNRISDIINLSLPKEEAAFLNAVIIGDKHSLNDEERDNFAKVGLAHVLSISGLHVAFIVLLLNKALEMLKIKKKKDLLCTLLIIYYVALIGAPPPALRTLIMMLIAIWGKHIKRNYDMVSAASLAAIIMLAFNPLLVHNQGFIISFACIYSIAFLYEPVYNSLGKIIANLHLRKALALPLSIQLGIIPILVYYFNYLSIISIFINIISIPIVFIIIAAGFIGVFAGAIVPILGMYVFSVDYYFIKLLNKMVDIAAQSPLSGLYIPSFPLFFYSIYYLIIMIALFKDIGFFADVKKRRLAVAIMSVLLLIPLSNVTLNNNIRLVFLDVGQGDSSLITTSKGKHVLIDGGGSAGKGDYYFDVGSKITVPSLLKLGVWSIDTIIVSHIHEDHLEGLLETVKTIKTGKVIMPDVPYESGVSKKFMELCKEKKINVIYAKAGDELRLDSETVIEIVFPEKSLLKYTKSDENNNSLVAILKFRNFKALYTGDIEKEGEWVLHGKDIIADVIKVPHHGSNSSSTEEFIKAVSPKVSIISVGKNTFGHPSKDVISRLEMSSQAIYRTDINGAISLKTNGNKVIIKTVR